MSVPQSEDRGPSPVARWGPIIAILGAIESLLCARVADQLSETPKLLDATDALAVALCHHFHDGRLQTKGRNAGWKSFIEENPGRIKGGSF